MTVGELMEWLEGLPSQARVVVPMHGAYRDADCLAARLILDGSGPGAHRLASTDDTDTVLVDGAIICNRAKAAELREER